MCESSLLLKHDINFMDYIDCTAIEKRYITLQQKKRDVDVNFEKILQSRHSIRVAPFVGGRKDEFLRFGGKLSVDERFDRCNFKSRRFSGHVFRMMIL